MFLEGGKGGGRVEQGKGVRGEDVELIQREEEVEERWREVIRWGERDYRLGRGWGKRCGIFLERKGEAVVGKIKEGKSASTDGICR